MLRHASPPAQGVNETVPCAELPALVTKTSLPSSASVFVIDQSLAPGQAAADAFDGPAPPTAPAEPEHDTQLFYYYYSDDADDTSDAAAISGAVLKSLLASKLGDARGAGAMAAALPGALRAGVGAAAAEVSKQDGPADANATSIGWGLLQPLRQLDPITVISERINGTRGRLSNATATAAARRAAGAQRRTSTISAGTGSDPSTPSWLITSGPNAAPDVYARCGDACTACTTNALAPGRACMQHC